MAFPSFRPSEFPKLEERYADRISQIGKYFSESNPMTLHRTLGIVMEDMYLETFAIEVFSFISYLLKTSRGDSDKPGSFVDYNALPPIVTHIGPYEIPNFKDFYLKDGKFPFYCFDNRYVYEAWDKFWDVHIRYYTVCCLPVYLQHLVSRILNIRFTIATSPYCASGLQERLSSRMNDLRIFLSTYYNNPAPFTVSTDKDRLAYIALTPKGRSELAGAQLTPWEYLKHSWKAEVVQTLHLSGLNPADYIPNYNPNELFDLRSR